MKILDWLFDSVNSEADKCFKREIAYHELELEQYKKIFGKYNKEAKKALADGKLDLCHTLAATVVNYEAKIKDLESRLANLERMELDMQKLPYKYPGYGPHPSRPRPPRPPLDEPKLSNLADLREASEKLGQYGIEQERQVMRKVEEYKIQLEAERASSSSLPNYAKCEV